MKNYHFPGYSRVFLQMAVACFAFSGSSAHAAQTFNDPLELISYIFSQFAPSPAPAKPRRGRPASAPQASAAPVPPRRPAGFGATTQPKEAPTPPRRPGNLTSAAPAPEPAPAKAAPAKAPAAPAPETPPKAASADCALKGFKEEMGKHLDSAISSLSAEVSRVQNSANNLGSSLDSLLAQSSCASMLSRGGFAKELGPDPRHSGLSLGQYKKQLPQKVLEGTTEKGKKLLGMKDLLSQLKKMKADLASFDFCSVDACSGAISAFKAEISPIVEKVGQANGNLEAIKKQLARDEQEEIQKSGGHKVEELRSDPFTTTACAEGLIALSHQADRHASSLSSSFDSLSREMKMRSQALDGKVLRRLDGASCGMAKNP